MKSHFNLTFIVLCFIFITSCSNDDDETSINNSSSVIDLPTDVEDLFIGKGNVNSETVILYEQGGPITYLDSDFFENGGTPESERFATAFENYYRVYVHQALTVSSEICSRSDKLTKEQSAIENEVNIEILDRVIKHFKSSGKTVYVVGHSYGGFVVTKYLAEKGNAPADKFLIMASRLEMPSVITDNLFIGIPYSFADGIAPTRTTNPEELALYEDFLNNCTSVLSIAASALSEQYTTTINSNDLSNIIFAYSPSDEQVGGLLESEITFLNSKNAELIEVDGGHNGMFTPFENANVIINKLIE